MRYNAMELRRAIIVDARLKSVHNPQVIQSVLMAVSKSAFPFQLTHMQGAQYILLLPHGADRQTFLTRFAQPLEDLGFVIYPWSEGINGVQLILKYRVWIELENVTPQAWTLDHLIPALSSFGILIEHAAMRGALSLQKLRAVIAVEELEDIPRSISMWIRGIKRMSSLSVLSWMNDPIPLPPMVDTTPPQSYFEKVQNENAKAISLNNNDLQPDGRGVVVDFDTIFSVWFKMEAGEKKERLGLSLKASPLFEQLLRDHEARGGKAESSGVKSKAKNRSAPSTDAPLSKSSEKFKSKEKGKVLEKSSEATGEGSVARPGPLFINAHGAATVYLSDTNPILSAPTEIIQNSNSIPIQHAAQEGFPAGPDPNLSKNLLINSHEPHPTPEESQNWASEPLTQMSAAQISPFKGPVGVAQTPSPNQESGSPLPTIGEGNRRALESPINLSEGNSSVKGSDLPSDTKAPPANRGDTEALMGTSDGKVSKGIFINYDYMGVPEPEEYFECEEETQEGDREALASYERGVSPMDIDPEEPTIYQSDTESYRGMCSAEFARLLAEVEQGDEREDVNEGNSKPTAMNFNDEECDLEEATGENEEEVIVEAETEERIEEGEDSHKGPRRSKRISARGAAKSYATPPKRSRKVVTNASKGACSRAMEGEKELRRALDDEFLKTTPLDETQVVQADYYCGIRQVNVGMIEAEASFEGNEEVGNTGGEIDPDKEESVLDGTNFDTNDELSDEEEGGESASK